MNDEIRHIGQLVHKVHRIVNRNGLRNRAIIIGVGAIHGSRAIRPLRRVVRKIRHGAVRRNGRNGVTAIARIIQHTDAAHAAAEDDQRRLFGQFKFVVDCVQDIVDFPDRVKAHPVPRTAVRPNDQNALFTQRNIVIIRLGLIGVTVVQALNIDGNLFNAADDLRVVDPSIRLERIGIDGKNFLKGIDGDLSRSDSALVGNRHGFGRRFSQRTGRYCQR